MPTRYELERIQDEAVARLIAEHNAEQSARQSRLDPPDYYRETRNLTGVPSNNGRTFHAAESSWEVHHARRPDGRHRAVGKVRTVGGDVLVTKPDGTKEIRSATSFRAPRTVKRTKRDSVEQANMVAEQLAAQSHRLALLAQAGNASDYNN